MKPVLLAMPGAQAMAGRLAASLPCEPGGLQMHRFPDGEWCPRVELDVAGRDVLLVAMLDDPDARLLPSYLAASVLRELGAASVGLVVPYLPYMRQDKQFEAGQGVTSLHLARLLSSCCDWLVTVDPHLHRHLSLMEIFSAATRVAHAAPAMAAWITRHVPLPIIIGPDEESEQWAAAVAALCGCPHAVLAKQRSGDREVLVSAPDAAALGGRTPVLVDDIVSTARTMAAAVRQLRLAGSAPPACVAVHALFAGDALAALKAAGAGPVVSCNTVVHASNAIDISAALAGAVRLLLPA